MSRLLLLACSRRKRPGTPPLPAIERYDGPAFRVLRSYLREEGAAPPCVFVLSAELGLVPGDHPVSDYDRRMTPTRADELAPAAAFRLRAILVDGAHASSSFACMGQAYRRALRAAPEAAGIAFASGGIGVQVAMLKAWLNATDEVPAPRRPAATLRGVPVAARTDALARAHARAIEDPAARRLGAYAVPLGDLLVPPKWLVSNLSGLPVGAFRTADALSVLAALGLPVHVRTIAASFC